MDTDIIDFPQNRFRLKASGEDFAYLEVAVIYIYIYIYFARVYIYYLKTRPY